MNKEQQKVPTVYEMAMEFKRKYPGTIAWRIKKNSSVVQKHLNPTEEVKYVFVAQKGPHSYDILSTCVVAITSERIIVARKRVIIGYFFNSVTADMFNDLKIHSGLLWGRVLIDTINELITLTNISKRSLPELETHLSTHMAQQKQKYGTFVKNASE
jgi:hypothetical protein